MKIQGNLINNFSYVRSVKNEKLLKIEEDKMPAVKDNAKEEEKAEADRAKKEQLEAAAEEMRKMTEAANEQLESKKAAARKFGAVLEIFRRIARGDRVPPKDESALMEYDMKLYLSAKNAAQMAARKKIKKYKKSLIAELEKMEKERQLKKAEETKEDKSSSKDGEAGKVKGVNNYKIGEKVGTGLDISI